MGRLTVYVSDIAYSKVSDADFQTVMKSVGFHKTPREVLTVGDMELFNAKQRLNGNGKL